MLGHSLHHRIAPDGIECVSEVQLHKCSGSIHAHELAAGCMYQCLCSPLCTHPQLCLPKHPPHDSRARVLAILDTRWRRVRPTAMGRMPPSFLVNGRRDAPKNTGRTTSGTPPLRTRFAKSANISARSPPTLSLTRSLRCCGRSPSLPPADPGAND